MKYTEALKLKIGDKVKYKKQRNILDDTILEVFSKDISNKNKVFICCDDGHIYNHTALKKI